MRPPIFFNLQPLEYKAYIINSQYPNGTPITTQDCKITWTVTRGIFSGNDAYGNPSAKTDTKVTQNNGVNIYWQNENDGNAKLKATFTSDFGYGTGSCPYQGTSVTEYSVGIRYLGTPGIVKVNNSYNNPYSLSCGSQTVNLSAEAATNADSYQWVNVPSGWSGNRTTSTPSANFTADASSGASNIYVIATRNDVTTYSTASPYVSNVTRPLPTTPTLQTSNLTSLPEGGLLLCSTQTVTAQSSNATSYNWSTTGGISLSASGNQASVSGSSDGTIQVSASSSSCNYTTPATSVSVYAGAPSSSSISITDDYGQPTPGSMCNGTGLVIKAFSPKATSYSWSLSGNSQNVYFTDYGGGRAYFNSYVNDC